MNKNGTLSESRSSKLKLPSINNLTYYNQIPRTSDLLKSSEFSIDAASSLLISKFFISPATMRYDDLVEETLFELNTIITQKMKLPEKEDLLNKSIQELLSQERSLDKKTNNAFKHFITSQGHTGVMTKVASGINSSTIDQLSRAILTEEGIFLFLACRAIIGFEITDPEGITGNIFESLDLVKSYINVQLVDKVIKKESLEVTKKEVKILKDKIENTRISYFPGAPENTVVELIDDLKSGGKLYLLVMNFLNSGKVTLDRATNKEALAKKMVDYLLKLGYNEDFNQEEEDNTTQEENPLVPDEFEAIEGVGSVIKKELIEVGIMSFSHLASFDEVSLKKRLKKVRANINYGQILEQAKFIAKGQFRELLAYQDNLNKR